MDTSRKNEIVKLYLENKLSQKEIGMKFSIKQPAVSKIISAYKNGSFVYNDTTVEEQSSAFISSKTENLAEHEHTVPPAIESEPVIIPANNDITKIAIDEQTAVYVSDEFSEQPIETVVEYEHSILENETSQPVTAENTAECEQEIKSQTNKLLDKSKITLTNHGLWLNQFALKLLNNPSNLAYSFDSNKKLFIEPYVDDINYPFFYCTAKCSNNYTKTANKQLINDLIEQLEIQFDNNININLNRDSYKISFNFTFENGYFVIDLPTCVSEIKKDII